MTTCTCCGQALPSAPRGAVRVDDALLRLCNRAYEEAARRSCERVEIAHLVWSLTSGGLPDVEFERIGVRRFALAMAADRWLVEATLATTADPPQTSRELKLLLGMAEETASRNGRDYAEPGDALSALVHGAGRFASAAFVVEALGGGDRRSRREFHVEAEPLAVQRRDQRGERTQRTRGFDCDDAAGSGARGAAAGAGGQMQPAVAALLERLDRQERLVGELTGALAELLTRSGQAEAAIDPPSGDDDEMAELAAAEPRNGAGHGSGRSGSVKTSRMQGADGGLRWRRRRSVQVGGGGGGETGGRSEGSGQPDQSRLPAFSSRGGQRGAGAERSSRYRLLRNSSPEGAEPLRAVPDNDADEEADATGGDRMKRFYLSPDDDIVRAPSIGPRTAARLKPAGLVLVRDLLACDPGEVAVRVGARYMTADRIADWRAQARLVCTIPWLRGTHAQLLVGAGYDTLHKLMRADPSIVCAAILRFAATREGQSILRSGPPPEIDRIACWIENTALAEPARAA